MSVLTFRNALVSASLSLGCLLLSFFPHYSFGQLLRDGSFELVGNPYEPGMGWTVCVGDPDAQVLDGSGPGIFGVNTPPANGQHYVGMIANDQGAAEALGQSLLLEAGMHYFGSVSLFRSTAHQSWNGTAAFQIWGGADCSSPEELLWTSGPVTNVDAWREFTISFAPLYNHSWISAKCALQAGSGEMTYLCADDLRLDNSYFAVDFLGFEATAAANAVSLEWETVALEDRLDFQVEWSRDGQNFEHVGTVEAWAGNSAFAFTHTPSDRGRQFYRIKSVDLGGHEDLSEIRQVLLTEEGLQIFPNPAHDRVTVATGMSGSAIQSVVLRDLSGKEVHAWDMDGVSQVSLDLPAGLSRGYYLLQVQAQGITTTRRLLIGQE
jgi:hypothetical protein